MQYTYSLLCYTLVCNQLVCIMHGCDVLYAQITAWKTRTIQPFLVAVLDFAVVACRRYGHAFCHRLGMSPFWQWTHFTVERTFHTDWSCIHIGRASHGRSQTDNCLLQTLLIHCDDEYSSTASARTMRSAGGGWVHEVIIAVGHGYTWNKLVQRKRKTTYFFSSQCRIYTFYIFKNAIIMLEADSRFARRLHCPLPSPTRAR